MTLMGFLSSSSVHNTLENKERALLPSVHQCCIYDLMGLFTLLLSQLVTGGRDTTALLESLNTAYDSAPSMRVRYLLQETHKDDVSARVATVHCIYKPVKSMLLHNS